MSVPAVTFHVTPMQVLAEAADDQPDRYCYDCRKRLPHSWQLVGDPAPSYYGPTPGIVCSGCGEDRTCFPGCEWDGPRDPGDAVWSVLTAHLFGFPGRRAEGDRP